MSDHRRYDVVVVGAGPAGLSAARTAVRLGFNTVVLERLQIPGQLRHPCSGVLTPVPGFVSGRRLFGGLFFPGLDLLIPSSIIHGYPPVQRYVSPSGYQFEATLAATADFPAAVVDKPALLSLLAEQAASVGAELRFESAVTGLEQEDGRVIGVRTSHETIRADVVISAEGVSRHLCQEAGLYGETARAGGKLRPSVVLINQDMQAPAVTERDLGQVFTFGTRYTSAPRAFGTVVFPAPGRASVYFTVFSNGARLDSKNLPWFYLEEYTARDPRVRDLLKGSRLLGRASYPVRLLDVPRSVTQDGFIGAGDAVTPGGHLGILPAMYLGRQAALAVAEALSEGRASRSRMGAYEELLSGTILPSLEAESRLLSCLTRMSDEELDHLCQALNRMPRATPLFSNWRTLTWEMMGWIMRQLPLILKDWERFNAAISGSSVELEL